MKFIISHFPNIFLFLRNVSQIKKHYLNSKICIDGLVLVKEDENCGKKKKKKKMKKKEEEDGKLTDWAINILIERY